MRKGLLAGAFSLLVVAAPGVIAQTRPVQRQIATLEDEWIKGVVARDAKAFDKLLHANFVYTEDDRVYTKAELIKEVTSGTDTVKSGRNEDLRVRVVGKTAIATGWLVLQGRGPSGAFTRRYRYTDTWVEANGTWRVIAAADYLKP